MNDERASLAGEVDSIRLQLRASTTGSDAARRVGAARARFLPYVIVGGIPFAMLTALIVAQATGSGDEMQAPMVAGLTAGIVVGMTVGWASLQLLERVVWRRSPHRLPLDAAIVAATVPAYALAGWVAGLVAVAVATMDSGSSAGPTIPNLWPVLLVSAAVIYPLSYVFARRDLDRPTNLMGAISAALDEPNEVPSKGYSIVATFVVAIAWMTASLFALAWLLGALQSLWPDRYESAFDRTSAAIAIAVLVGWLALSIGATAGTLRVLRRVLGR